MHGLPRATVDIDLLVLTESLKAAWKIVERLNYSIEVCRFLSTGEQLKFAVFLK